MVEMILKRFLLLLLLINLLASAGLASAHASLVRAEPAPNARLASSPSAFHLWFSEPVEPAFSHVELRDSSGALIRLPAQPTVVEDGKELAITPGDLPDGVYTVAWRVVSATDGHPTQGSYAVIIGAATTFTGASESSTGATTGIDQTIPWDGAAVRWLNILSLALLVGLPVFVVFIARPPLDPLLMRRLWAVNWIGWMFVGVTTLLLMALETSILSGSLTPETFAAAAFGSRFGTLWLARVALWVLYGLILMYIRRPYRFLIAAAGALLVTQSLYSHASGLESPAFYLAADWLHLAAESAWIGGLVGLLVVIGLLRQQPGALGRWVARFSNLGRGAVLLLIVTGTLAAFQQIGSLDALFATTYGQALIVKLLLFLPLIAIAAVNLLVTSRRLRLGEVVWTGRLRLLTGGEIALAVGIMGAVGVMTAIPPAKIAYVPPAPPVSPPDVSFFEMKIQDGVMVHLSITPGTIGENTFEVDLYNEQTLDPIDDASLIRLRFDSRSQNIGESELRPVHESDGRYTITGSNLSLPGDWRIRISIQRPGKFDTVVDFTPHILSQEEIAAESAETLTPNSTLPSAATESAADVTPTASRFSDDTPVAVVPMRDETALPWLITQGGTLLQPDGSGAWQPAGLDARVNNAYWGLGNALWAASDSGLYRQRDGGAWEQLGTFSVSHLDSMHGYVFALGDGGILRVGEGGLEQDIRSLTVPQAGAPAENLAMLGDHSHILLNGKQIYLTDDLGLSWTPVEAPADVVQIAADADGNLMAITPNQLAIWNYTTSTWRQRAPLIFGAKVRKLLVYNGSPYVISDGQLYVLSGIVWRIVPLTTNAATYVTDIDFQYPNIIWAMDAGTRTLLHSTDGVTWEETPVR